MSFSCLRALLSPIAGFDPPEAALPPLDDDLLLFPPPPLLEVDPPLDPDEDLELDDDPLPELDDDVDEEPEDLELDEGSLLLDDAGFSFRTLTVSSATHGTVVAIARRATLVMATIFIVLSFSLARGRQSSLLIRIMDTLPKAYGILPFGIRLTHTSWRL